MTKVYNCIIKSYNGDTYGTIQHTEDAIIGFGETKSPDGLWIAAGIELIETDDGWVGERDWYDGEKLQTALEVLQDDGRTFNIYDIDSEAQTAEFKAECKRLGL